MRYVIVSSGISPRDARTYRFYVLRVVHMNIEGRPYVSTGGYTQVRSDAHEFASREEAQRTLDALDESSNPPTWSGVYRIVSTDEDEEERRRGQPVPS
jgi:hypothetical protein